VARPVPFGLVNEPRWQRRFTAPRIIHLAWADHAPDRLGAITNESGSWQAWAWHLSSGERRRVSDSVVGVEEVHVLPDGSGIVWWDDETGNERGRWMVSAFDGGTAGPLVPALPRGWQSGVSLVANEAAVGLATDDDEYRIFVATVGGQAREIYHHGQPAGVGNEWPQGRGGLSPDGSLVAIRHAEHGDIERTAVRVLDARTGATVAELLDDGSRLLPVAWSPLPGEARLLLLHERDGWERPAVLDVASGTRIDLDPGVEGGVFPEGWLPDGRVLLRQAWEGRDRLFARDLEAETLDLLFDAGGTIDVAGVRPDGDVWIGPHSSARPQRWISLRGDAVVALPEDDRPEGRPYRSFFLENSVADRIQAFVATPEGDAPFPTIVSIHGGPNSHHTDGFDEGTQAYVDHGYAVLLVNYRGSTGYGVRFRDALRGNIGFPESEDIAAALDRLIDDGVADPERVFLEGWSWGGYLATLNAGLHPDRWRAVAAGIPVGDYVAAHYECAPSLRAWDLAVMGGSPMEVPELYRERNPMTYVDAVRAPMLIIAGEHDSRCPLGQIMTYAHALKARGGTVEIHLYPGGHHTNDVAEQIRHVERVMEFFARHR
jgi:dipeptidyl aminopeptidase/acylaminoacyl peptidase